MLREWNKETILSIFAEVETFCGRAGQDPVYSPVTIVLDFRVEFYDSRYSALNSGFSTLSMVVLMVTKFMTSQKPALPRYTATWDVNIVLCRLPALAHCTLIDVTTAHSQTV